MSAPQCPGLQLGRTEWLGMICMAGEVEYAGGFFIHVISWAMMNPCWTQPTLTEHLYVASPSLPL